MNIVSFASKMTRTLFPLSLLSAAMITPVYANGFHTFPLDPRLNVGSAASPGADDLRGSRYYPVDSLLQNEQGIVGVKVFLDADGNAKDAVVEKTSGFRNLDAAAIRYVKENYDYDPAPGKVVPEVVRMMINFKMESLP
jgi:TonB family protein